MNYNKKYLPLIIGITLAFGFWAGGLFHFNSNADIFVESSKKQKLSRLIDYIDNDYVDDVNTDSIVDVAVNKILSNLDPHSVYIPRKRIAGVSETMNGKFVGIGVQFFLRADTISVIKVLPGGPSERSGLLTGDKILLANNDTLYGKGITNDKVIRTLKGEIDSKVKLTLYRASEDKLMSIDVFRGFVPLRSVPVSYMIQDGLGYVRINRFISTTYDEFKVVLKELINSGMTSLVLDLRGNPGGFLDKAQLIADEFLEQDKLILFTKDKKGEIENFFATSSGDFENGHVYVLQDEESASASEIVAGALQDNDKGTIVGRRSYGKGLVQREMQLGDGSVVRLTVSRYYTPTGRSIQKPYKDLKNESYNNDFKERYLTGELTDSTQIKIIDSLKFTTPAGKVVYGGGGIVPDVFVPLQDNDDYEKIFYVINSPYLSDFVFDLMEKDRKFYNDLSENNFINEFNVSDTDVSDFKIRATVLLKGTWSSNSAYDEEIRRAIKAEMASQLFNENLSYKIKNIDDLMIQKVIEIHDKK